MERNKRNQKSNLTFEAYCAQIEELLKLMGRKIGTRAPIAPDHFKL